MNASSQSRKPAVQAAVEQAEKRVGAVLQDLESETGADVQDIGLEDLVDTDPDSGRPVLRRAVDIDVRQRPERSWVR